jgi:hypothetical protein
MQSYTYEKTKDVSVVPVQEHHVAARSGDLKHSDHHHAASDLHHKDVKPAKPIKVGEGVGAAIHTYPDPADPLHGTTYGDVRPRDNVPVLDKGEVVPPYSHEVVQGGDIDHERKGGEFKETISHAGEALKNKAKEIGLAFKEEGQKIKGLWTSHHHPKEEAHHDAKAVHDTTSTYAAPAPIHAAPLVYAAPAVRETVILENNSRPTTTHAVIPTTEAPDPEVYRTVEVRQDVTRIPAKDVERFAAETIIASKTETKKTVL